MGGASATFIHLHTLLTQIMARSIILLGLLLHEARAAPTLAASTLPIVDLDYEKHQAIELNPVFGFYNFSNIPYAAPPVGDLRWRKPEPPLKSDQVNIGDISRTCAQASTSWGGPVGSFAAEYAYESIEHPTFSPDTIPYKAKAATFAYNPGRGSEDCLYLDVIVPKNVFDGKEEALKPVLGDL